MPDILKINPTRRQILWRLLVNFWTIITYMVIIADFLSNGSYEDFVIPAVIIYTGILAVYSAEKEFERWYENHNGRHPGEIYVVLWTLLIGGILISGIITHSHYKMPSEVFGAYIAVISILAITKKSKKVYCERYPEKNPANIASSANTE